MELSRPRLLSGARDNREVRCAVPMIYPGTSDHWPLEACSHDILQVRRVRTLARTSTDESISSLSRCSVILFPRITTNSYLNTVFRRSVEGVLSTILLSVAPSVARSFLSVGGYKPPSMQQLNDRKREPVSQNCSLCRKPSLDLSVAGTVMSNEILFYDISIQSPSHPNQRCTPNTLYEYPKNNRHLRLILRSDI